MLWCELEVGMGMVVWFCDLQVFWQKGIVENINKCVWCYLLLEIVVFDIIDQDICVLCDWFNDMLRKCLEFRMLKEVFCQYLLVMGL